MKKKNCSLYELNQVNKLIFEIYKLYGTGLEYEECWGDAWIAYMETR